MNIAKMIMLLAVSAFSTPATATGNMDSLECQSLSAKFAAAQAQQISLTETYSACISTDLRPQVGGEFLGFTCEFELNQAIRGQARVSAAVASASHACALGRRPIEQALTPTSLVARPVQLLSGNWSRKSKNEFKPY